VSAAGDEAILTLEPLIEAIREGVERTGWELSGLQKTTSHDFEGRWEGESTRSAYLFFHLPNGPDPVSVDVYLDETSRGLTGNLALVVDLVPLGHVRSATSVLRELGAASAARIAPEYRRPLSLRFRLADAVHDPAGAESEVRFKVRIPRKTIRAGAAAVATLATDVVAAFARVLECSALRKLIADDGDGREGTRD